jgi:hypothetical protein
MAEGIFEKIKPKDLILRVPVCASEFLYFSNSESSPIIGIFCINMQKIHEVPQAPSNPFPNYATIHKEAVMQTVTEGTIPFKGYL